MTNLPQSRGHVVNGNKLHPSHIADLKKSELSDETILKAGIKSVPPDMINKKLGFNISDLTSCYEIPYGKDFSRFRTFYTDNKNGKQPKYLQRKNTCNRLYIPPDVRPLLSNPALHLCITEGEKKALKATQEGLPCIALSGLWTWSDGTKELIPDFDQIALKGRTVYIIPDNDWLQPNKHGYKKNLRQAVYQLAEKLKERGARVYVVQLPQGNEKGLDDYLCKHTVQEFEALPVMEVKALTEKIAEATQENIQSLILEIADIESKTEQSLYVQKLSEKLKVSKRVIQKDIKLLQEESKTDIQTVISANFKELVDLVTDENGQVAYLIKNGNDFLEVATVWKVDKVLYVPPDRENLPFTLARAKKAINWYKLDNDQRLFEDTINYLKTFSYLENKQWLIIACNVFLTYIQDHQDIHYLPMILFFAVPERGKTRTGKAVTYISYRGIHLVDLREANLFRFSQDLRATLFFDIMNLWKKAEKNGAEDILLLRYEKGAKAARVIYPEKGAFKDMKHYEVYGATIMATNEPVHKILDTRCIVNYMPNKPGDYENPTPGKAQELKERLTAWRARVIDRQLPEIELIQGLNGRLWDISKPLLQVCKMVCPQVYGDLMAALLEVAGQRIEDRKASIEGQITTILYELSPEGIPEWTVKTSEVLGELNKERPEGHKLSSQYLGKRLKAMGLHTKIIMGYSQIQINRHEMNIFLEQYGLKNISLPIPAETLLNSTILLNQEKSMTYSSRELVESEGNSTDSLLTEGIENKEEKRVVESSRELPEAEQEIIIEGVKA